MCNTTTTTTAVAESQQRRKVKVAVIGGGVTGLSAAWHLSENCNDTADVTLFESEDRLGGHAYTVPVPLKNSNKKSVDVDIGFMVFNETNYPNMTKWFEVLSVLTENSDMSLSVSLDGGDTLEWSSNGLDGVFAKRSQLYDRKFYKMLNDMNKFHIEAPKFLLLHKDDPRRLITTKQYLKQYNYSNEFAIYYLLPMMAALWSASMENVLDFPAIQLISFLCNHQMLQLFNRPQWKTVKGRSHTYTKRVQEILGKKKVRLSTPIVSMKKIKNDDIDNKDHHQYELFTTDNVSVGIYDDVIFACHTDTTTSILKTDDKESIDPSLIDTISKIEYSDNVVYLHSDPKLMPQRRRAWASWNCLGNSDSIKDAIGIEGKDGRMKAVYVTYWLNRLQNLDTTTTTGDADEEGEETDIFVSLNPHDKPDPELTHKRTYLQHPQFTPSTLEARSKLLNTNGDNKGEYQGKNGLWFCGAWSGYGFHEDGCRSGFDIATKLSGIPLPWVKNVSYDLPVAICKKLMLYFLKQAVVEGKLLIKFNDNSIMEFGNGEPCGDGLCDDAPVTIRVFDPWMFVKVAWEYDLGLARSYMAGYFVIEPLEDVKQYNPVLRPPTEPDETSVACGDPVGLTRLLLLMIGNRDRLIGKGGSLKNIHAHYDLSNDLFKSFLDKETLMYSSAIYDCVSAPSPQRGLVFKGTLEEAQWRKLDTLLDRAQVQPGQTVLDIGFGWGGLSLHAAQKYGCTVVGITLSVEQRALAMERVKAQGLEHLITFEVIDYRTFARRPSNIGKFDRVLSCEMIEAVGHDHLHEFFWVVEQVLKPDGILVMEAITTTEERYENYLKSTDFINTVIFPGSCCPCLHALVDAAYKGSRLTLEHIDNIGLHYAQTLADWRRRFNAQSEFVSQDLGFDDIFLRAWNYYLCYCEAGFYARNVNCLILVFARNGCKSLTPLYETRACTQLPALTETEISNWISDKS
ncbi:CMAS-domain-containing protein [Fragilariopsis cylindrus CCMP1102]|uniref:CMAS-domain-containing protein n=1 Tax=Fragilariopsis cylindrus CCMP1102 TaxID=635003 RepID=A0A1E7FIA1_9STRA|nr:CMAS-domain-containing protein [Fragilariopsis cylindrus CCMP1102]|eukprot:OEU17902.1 CMAS-domain-containing protein [Fragilariopsis cylindrus CCMP1102]